MTRAKSKSAGWITIAAVDGSVAHRYQLIANPDTKRAWYERTVPDQKGTPGEFVDVTWSYFGGGMGEAVDVGRGGYYFGQDCYVGNPFAIRPRATVTGVTLTGNTIPVTRQFEAESASGTKFLYNLAGSKVFKINLSTKTLVNTKDLTTASVYFRTGAYTGTGAASRAITGLGFAPDCVIVKVAGATAPLIRIRGMAANTSKLWTGTTSTTNILSLDDDGFTVATNSNTSGYTFHWIAWKESAGYVDIGSYAGDGNATQAITGVGFQADLLWVFDAASDADEGEVVARHSTHNANEAIVYHDGGTFSDCLATLNADGFTVKNNTRVNASGHTYWYIAFKVLTDHFTVGTYVGDGTDNRNLGDADLTPDIGYTPQYVIASRYGTSVSVHRSDTCSGDSTMQYTGTANQTNQIQSLIADGFQVGSNATVQTTSATYHYAAWVRMDGGIPIFGQSASWDSIWHVPCGDDVDFKRLTTITDDTADDTWTGSGGLKAQHFCVVENALARARSDRILDKCSETDTTVAGNWGGEYKVGKPGEYVTQLVPVGDQLGVCTNLNYYLWDVVSVARPQLGENKPSSADNGKGALQWFNHTFLPYGRLWDHSGGEVSEEGPDALPFHQSVSEVSNEPAKLTHYALAAADTWIYSLSKEPGGYYYLMYFRWDSATRRFKWDTLYSGGTTVSKQIFVDSTPTLWWASGNDLKYIPLAANGSPEGGTFGETETGYLTLHRFYFPEVDFGTRALKRLHVAEIEVRNSQAGLGWALGYHRDGGTTETVGSGIFADGQSRVYWASGTSDTCRVLRPFLWWATAVTYVPDTVPPEVFRLTIRAEELPVDADIIEATVLLDGETNTKLARLKARRRAGAAKVWDPDKIVLQSPIYPTIFEVQAIEIDVEPGEEPIKAAVIRMRRSDTS